MSWPDRRFRRDGTARFTGCRWVRGTHAGTHVYDPLGIDFPPRGWPHDTPDRFEVGAALQARRHRVLTLSEVTGLVLPSRQNVFDRMLSKYVEVNDPLASRGTGSGDGVAGMPGAWNASYRKLERLLRVYRDTDRYRYWHLQQFYLARTVRLTIGCRGCGAGPFRSGWHHHRGQQFRTDERIFVVARHPDVDNKLVHGGLEWLNVAWGEYGPDIGEPMLPDEIVREQGSKDAIAA